MPNPLVKLWKYLTASANAQIDQRADPKIQIAQAIEAEQQRHQALANQAAAVLGNQRQLEMRLNRQLGRGGEAAGLRPAGAGARRQDAGRGRRGQGDRVRERPRRPSPPSWSPPSSRWRTSSAVTTRPCRPPSRPAARSSRAAMRLQTTLAERTKLMSQLEQAKMQEHVAASMRQVNELPRPATRRSLSEVRDKIEAPVRQRARVRPSSPRARSRAGCSRCRRRRWTSPGPRGWTRSAPR